jgi:hypothetical protein
LWDARRLQLLPHIRGDSREPHEDDDQDSDNRAAHLD